VTASWLGLGWAEPLAAAGIGLMVAWMGLKSAGEGLDVLMDRVSDPELRLRIQRTARAEPGVLGVTAVRLHPLGSTVHVELDVALDARSSLGEAHAVARRLESRILRAEPDVHEVRVSLRPASPVPGDAAEAGAAPPADPAPTDR